MARSLVTFLLIAALAYGGLVLITYLAQRTLIYPGAAMGGELPDSPLWGERVEIGTSDGERLAAIWRQPDDDAPTIIVFHGNADRIDRYGFLADAVAARGAGLLALSYRGYAGSTGSPTEAGLFTDGLAAYDFVRARSDAPIVLMGQSLGSGVAVHVAAGRNVQGLILVSAFDSILEVARRAYFFLPVGPLLKDRYRSDLVIGAITAPKLFVHGDRDGVIPIARGRALYDAAAEPKRFVELPGYGHNDIWDRPLLDAIDAYLPGLFE